jgi:hypothetical protein
LPTGPVERRHPLAEQALAQRVLRDERLQLRRHRRFAAERELRVDARLHRREPQLLEALDRGACEVLVGQVGERRAPPQLERFAQQLGGLAWRGVGRPVRQRLEAGEVELLGRERHDVARWSRRDRRG